jgi:hypothetical protein
MMRAFLGLRLTTGAVVSEVPMGTGPADPSDASDQIADALP